jgi:hypothetical protein
MLADELEAKLHTLLPPSVLSPPPRPAHEPSAPATPPPIDVKALKDEICSRLSGELAAMKRQLLDQDQFWKEQMATIEEVHKLELEALRKNVEFLNGRSQAASNPSREHFQLNSGISTLHGSKA